MTFTFTLDTGKRITDRQVARYLRDVATAIETCGVLSGVVRDPKGNIVGRFARDDD